MVYFKRKLAVLVSVSLIFSILLASGSKVSAETVSFTDINGHWAEKAIIEGANRGILYGVGDGQFAPNAPLTYEQFMTMVSRMLSQNQQFINDPESGCKMVIVNNDKIMADTKGDISTMNKYLLSYVDNNPDINSKLNANSNYLSSNNFNKGQCGLTHWNNYNDGESIGSPLLTNSEVSNIDSWASSGVVQVPYVAGFINYYNLAKNNGKSILDFKAYAETNGVSSAFYSAEGDYYDKRIYNVYDKLNSQYIYNGNKNNNLKREDMALILYSFLDYDQQKLITTNQNNIYYDSSMSSNELKTDYSYKDFNTNYSDIPKYFQVGTIINNPDHLKEAQDMGFSFTKYGTIDGEFFYNYIAEKMFAKNAYEDGNIVNKNVNVNLLHPLELTSRGVILAVSDARLLSGAYGKFSPKKSLTRAEGVTVVLNLEKYIKERYNFSN